MTLDALRLKVSNIISAACSAEFYFLLDNGGEISIKRADIDQSACDELTDNLIETISNTILLDDELSLMTISGADDRKNAIYKYDLEEVPIQIQRLATILEQDEFDIFTFETDDLSDLKGILVVLGHDTQQLALYKHQYPVALLKRDSSFSLIRNRDQNRLVKLDDDIIRVNSKFEFMRIEGEYFIIDIKTLERFFGFHEAVRNVATQGISNIESTGLVVDISVLQDRIDDISFARKLIRSAKNSPVLGVIPNDEVVAFVSTHPVLRNKFKLSEDGSQLNLTTKTSQNLFLKLLNDDFLQSELTKHYYASLAKDKLDESSTA